MASLNNRNGNYQAQFYNPDRSPTRKRFSLRTSDKAQARRKLSELEETAEAGEFDPWRDDPFDYRTPERAKLPLSEAIEQFAEQKER